MPLCSRALARSFVLTMRSMTDYLRDRFADSPELFASTCATLMAKMLDTVPRGVQLTEVVTPLPVKPSTLSLVLGIGGDVLQFSGQVRVRPVFSH